LTRLTPQDVGVDVFAGQPRCGVLVQGAPASVAFVGVQDVWSPDGPQAGASVGEVAPKSEGRGPTTPLLSCDPDNRCTGRPRLRPNRRE
jgi:hypothetical protein